MIVSFPSFLPYLGEVKTGNRVCEREKEIEKEGERMKETDQVEINKNQILEAFFKS